MASGGDSYALQVQGPVLRTIGVATEQGGGTEAWERLQGATCFDPGVPSEQMLCLQTLRWRQKGCWEWDGVRWIELA